MGGVGYKKYYNLKLNSHPKNVNDSNGTYHQLHTQTKGDIRFYPSPTSDIIEWTILHPS